MSLPAEPNLDLTFPPEETAFVEGDALEASLHLNPASPNSDFAGLPRADFGFHAIDILEQVKDAFVALDSRWHILYANREACRLNQKPLEAFRGKVHWDEWPANIGTDLERAYRRVMDERTEAHFEHHYADSTYNVWVEVDVYPAASGGLNIFYRDITERRRAEDTLRRSQQDLRLAVGAARLGTFYCDYPLDKIAWNDTCKEHFFLPLDAEVDFTLFYSLLHPDDREPTRRAIECALRDQAEYNVEYRTLAPDGRTRWINAVGRFYYDADGSPTRFDGVTRNISARKAAEEEVRRRAAQDRFLAGLAERARGLTNPDEVIADAVRSLGQFLGAARCLFADIDIKADECTIPVDYCADDSIASMAGTFPLSVYGPFLVGEHKSGRSVAVEDVYEAPSRFPAEYLPDFDAIRCRAFLAVPVLHSAQLVSVVAVHGTVPRAWQSEEVELLQAVVERTWLTVEVLRQQKAIVQEAEARRARAEREALLGRVSAAIRSAADPEAVLETAVRELGLALDADRCYYATYDQDADTATAGPEWHRAGLPSMAGRYTMSQHTINQDPVYKEGRTQVVVDTAVDDPTTHAAGMRALVRVPLVSGRAMTALSVAMAASFRVWSEDEVSLVEAVATQTQTALEAVRVQRREHQIAQQLQDALQPALPVEVPGLSLGKWTQPALDEAQVGGDFFDVFPLDKERYALVLGDVSGKGLAAAQQLALIRNSLRTTLYLYQSPAQAATVLNRIVTAQNLLIGFVTAFVGVYEVGTGGITYCSCGHEPGLIRRANGTVREMLEATGPPLGIAENAEYGENTVTLSAGDALLLYTDGLSEAGPSRRQMLGTAGLMSQFEALPMRLGVQAEAEALVTRVSAFSAGVFRDDVAVLMVRRQ